MKKRILFIILMGIILLAGSLYCSIGVTVAAADTDLLRIHQENPPKIFMPIVTAGREEEYVFELLYGRLTRVDEEGKVIASMAESWNLSEDKLTWTFKLRKDVTWHDGKPFTAKDVEFTMYTYLSKEFGKWWAGNYFSILGAKQYNAQETDTIEGIKVIDEYTIAFTTAEPNAAFPAVFVDCKIIPEHIWSAVEKTEDAYVQFANKPEGNIGTGPYKFVKYVTDEYLELERHDNYHLGQPKIQKIILQFAPVDTGMAMLEAGELDLVYEIGYEDIERLKAVSGIEVEEVPNAKWIWWIRYNLEDENPSPNKPFLLNPKFRKAVTLAFDRHAYVDSVLLGHGKVVDSNAYSIPWTVPPDLQETPYDPAAAKKLFEEIGWDFNKDSIRLLVYPSNKARDQIPPILQNYLRDIGVKSEIITKDLAAARVDMYETHDWDVVIGGWLQGVDPSLWAVNLTSTEAGGGRGNDGYGNPEVDELFRKGTTEFDFNARQKIYYEIVRKVHEDMPKTPVCLPNVVIARTSRLKDFILAPERGLGARFVNVHVWYLAE